MSEPVSKDSVVMAVELAKAAVPLQSGTWVTNPQAVAEFVEVLARKIESLRSARP